MSSAAASRRPRLRVRLTPRRRHVAAIITIALSTAFVAVMMLAGGLMRTSLAAGVTDQLRGADLVVGAPQSAGSDATPLLEKPSIEGAEQVWPQVESYAQVRTPGSDSPTFVRLVLDPPADVAPLALQSGRAARDGHEIVLDPDAADALHVGIGGSVDLTADDSPTGQAQSLSVVGIAAPSTSVSIGGGVPRLHVAADGAEQILGADALASAPTWLVSLPRGTDAQQVADRTDGADLHVLTAQQAEQEQVDAMMKGAASLGVVLGVFVVIALLTSAVVIANTFAVTLAQRVRSLALLRTLGAQRSQVARVVLGESLAVGLIGSVLGIVLGHLVVQAALAAAVPLGLLQGVIIVPVSLLSVLLPLAAGVLVTLAAGIGPVRAATRVAPLQALRPEPPTARRGPGLRGILALAAVVLGIAALAGGVALSLAGQIGGGVLLAILGGVLSFVGILVGLVVITGPLARWTGALFARIGGLPARIAAGNTTRNPKRSAATIAALLIGTTLMTMMAVGARTADVSLTQDLASRRPVDVVVTAQEMPADAAQQVAAVRGIGAAEAVRTRDIEVGADEPMTLYGASADQVAAVANRADLSEHVRDGVVLLGSTRAEKFGVTDGQELSLRGPDGTARTLRVQVDGDLNMSLVTPATLEQLVGDAAHPAVMARFAPQGSAARGDTDGVAISTGVRDLISQDGWTEARGDFSGIERETYSRILNVLLGITIALLAVAVVVALVGVANTLSLGVVERTGENALLRALGTTRSQMRAMLGWEGVLLAIIGAVLGIVMGGIYGVLGITSLLGSSFPVVISIPWLQIAAVLVLAVLAGWAASVLPGRRAARTAPAEALAGGE